MSALPSAPARLPAQLTSFVGRAAELADVCALVGDHRLVTLTGPGGVGKTRLAVQAADALRGGFGGEVWWVDLAPLTDPDLVTVKVARALGLPDRPGRAPLDILVRFIGERRILLLLDNCEHLLDACATLTLALLSGCPELRIVATSREPVGVPGELTWRTPSLSLTEDAVELFRQRARLARRDFVVTAENAATVTAICQRLDGMPLAIELAAARVRAMTLDEIMAGLRDRFRLLTGAARSPVPRQQTLRASVDWSHALLTGPERMVFRRLAVFQGGFDLDAAHAVAGDPDLPRYQLLDELSALVDKSLVAADDSGRRTRYRLLETMRQYALDKLADSGEPDTVRTRHRDYYTALAARLDGPASPDYQQRIGQAEIEAHNFGAAFAWSTERGDVELALRLASSLMQPLWLRGRILVGLKWFESILAGNPTVAPAARARALADKTILDALTGAFGRLDQIEPALTIVRNLDDPSLLARVLTACGATCAFSIELAAPYFTEAIQLTRSAGDDWRLSQTLAWQALSAFMSGDPIAARAAAQEGCELADTVGDGYTSRMCRWSLGMAEWLSAELSSAIAHLDDVAREAAAAHDPVFAAYSLLCLARTLAYRGDVTRARIAADAAVDSAADITGFQQALSRGALADALLAAGDVPAALAASEAAWRECAQLGLLGINAFPLAQVALARGDVDAARRWADDAVAAAPGAHRMTFLAVRVRVAIAQGDAEQAARDAREALGIAAPSSAYLTVPDVIECLAGLSADAGSHRDAARMLGAAQAIRDRTGQVRFKIYDAGYHAAVTALQGAMARDDFADAWAEGAALSTDDAICWVLRGHGERKRPSSGWASLTPTEREVAQLVSDGLGNKDIAARLFISPRTVQSHLTHLYAKLGLTSRVMLAQEWANHG